MSYDSPAVDGVKPEALNRALFEDSDDGLLIADADGRVIAVNTRGVTLCGYCPDDIHNLTLDDLITLPGAAGSLSALAGGGAIVGRDCVIRRPDGTLLPADVSLRPIAGGAYLAVLRDPAHRASEERLRQVTRVAKIGIFDHDHRTGAIYWSPEMRAIYGWGPDEPVSLAPPPGRGRSPSDVTYPEDRERVGAAVRRAHAGTGGFMDEEFRVVSAQGVVRWVRTQAQTFFEGEGPARRALRTIGATIDITERKTTEAERERLHSQLVQAQKMESVGRLAGGVAHDFNNMLNVISGYAELALRQIDVTSPLHGPLLEIQNAASRSTDLTRQLLAFARRQPVRPKVLDLNTLVEGALNMLRRLIGEDIELAWLPGSPLGAVKIDPAQVDQILVNLVVNARDAIVGHGQIRVRTRNVTVDAAFSAGTPGSVPGDYVTLEVTDDGRGMDEETKAHVFEPFFTTKGELQGTGLGLATVYGIVKQNDGFIGIDSEPGRGSTLTVLLPRVAEPSAKIEPASRRGAATGSETILLVEDEEMVLGLSTRMLESLGYTVLPAATPREAIQLAKQQAGRIDLLITDVVMPETSGQALAKHLLAAYPGLKCLYLSGYFPGSSLETTLGEDAHFLQKPFSRSDLAAKVRQALTGTGS